MEVRSAGRIVRSVGIRNGAGGRRMRITIEDDGYLGIAEAPVVEFSKVVDLFKQAAMASGFHPDTVLGYFKELEEE